MREKLLTSYAIVVLVITFVVLIGYNVYTSGII